MEIELSWRNTRPSTPTVVNILENPYAIARKADPKHLTSVRREADRGELESLEIVKVIRSSDYVLIDYGENSFKSFCLKHGRRSQLTLRQTLGGH